MFLPLDMRSWVPGDHFVWFLVDVVAQLDGSALEAGTTPGKGRPGYDPRMLATLVMYAMSCGVRSSREIEDRSRTDACFRIAAASQSPDYSTLCRFRRRTGGEDGPLEDLFTQVLYVCAVAGLGRLRVISVDGSKIWADASKEANRTLEGLRKLSRKVLEEAAAADGECDCDGHGHGDAAAGPGGDGGCGCCAAGMLPGLGLCGPAVLPAGWGGASRAERIAAALADLEAARAAEQAARREQAEAYLARVRAGQAPAGGVPAEVAVTVAEIALEQAIAAQQAKRDAWDARAAAAGGRGVRGGRRPAPPEQAAPVRRGRERLAAARKAAQARADSAPGQDPPGGTGNAAGTPKRGKKKEGPPQPVRNITDPDSRAMHCTRNGTVQAYNCQLPRADDGLVLAARATQDANDAAQVEPTLADITAARQVIAAGHRAAGHPPAWSVIGTVTYDSGYFSAGNCAAPGPDRLISPGAWHSAESSGPHTPACEHHDPRDQMAHNLSTRQGRDIYRRRAPLSEGGFSFLKDTIGLRRFSMRGLPLAQAELTLAATVHNLMLLHRRLPSLP